MSAAVPISTRVLTIITGVLLVAVLVTAVATWWITRQPPLAPVPIPSTSIG
jgi:hypothetical protein